MSIIIEREAGAQDWLCVLLPKISDVLLMNLSGTMSIQTERWDTWLLLTACQQSAIADVMGCSK